MSSRLLAVALAISMTICALSVDGRMSRSATSTSMQASEILGQQSGYIEVLAIDGTARRAARRTSGRLRLAQAPSHRGHQPDLTRIDQTGRREIRNVTKGDTRLRIGGAERSPPARVAE